VEKYERIDIPKKEKGRSAWTMAYCKFLHGKKLLVAGCLADVEKYVRSFQDPVFVYYSLWAYGRSRGYYHIENLPKDIRAYFRRNFEENYNLQYMTRKLIGKKYKLVICTRMGTEDNKYTEIPMSHAPNSFPRALKSILAEIKQ
jgi:hypothetical protein